MRATERAERVDRDLVEQAQRGDREAFAILARTRGDLLFGIARRIVRDVNLAEDARPAAQRGRRPGQSGNASGPRSASSGARAPRRPRAAASCTGSSASSRSIAACVT